MQMQSAKKYALGPRHDIAALTGAVAEPWLSVVIKDAAAAEQSGWFWTYKLDSVEVLPAAPILPLSHILTYHLVH